MYASVLWFKCVGVGANVGRGLECWAKIRLVGISYIPYRAILGVIVYRLFIINIHNIVLV